jgi:hypothetical protein
VARARRAVEQVAAGPALGESSSQVAGALLRLAWARGAAAAWACGLRRLLDAQLAARRACSFVACTASAGLTRAEGRELGLAAPRCGGRKVARYCSPACEAADWLGGGHKEACAALRAEAAAAVARGAD